MSLKATACPNKRINFSIQTVDVFLIEDFKGLQTFQKFEFKRNNWRLLSLPMDANRLSVAISELINSLIELKNLIALAKFFVKK